MASTVPPLGKLQPVDLRTIWRHEALDFTTWLSEHLEDLSAAIGLDLELVERESRVGSFSLDILARDQRNSVVVIENQLEGTDHTHLGQLLTYAAGYDAEHIIWISRDLREEHRAALDWLNNNTDTKRNFFGIQLEAIRIDDSNPAINFKVVVSPNAWQKTTAQTARETQGSSDQDELDSTFQVIHNYLEPTGDFRRLLKPLPTFRFYVVERTHTHIEYSIAFSRNSIRAEVILNFLNPTFNASLFDALKARGHAIQATVDSPIIWDFQPQRRRQALRVSRDIDRARLKEHRLDIASWCVGRLVEFRRAVEAGIDQDIISVRQLGIDESTPMTGGDESLSPE